MMTSHKRHAFSNLWSFECFFNILCGPTSKKHQSPRQWPFVRGIHWWPVNSSHIGPVTRKKFPLDYVTMLARWWYQQNSSDLFSSEYPRPSSGRVNLSILELDFNIFTDSKVCIYIYSLQGSFNTNSDICINTPGTSRVYLYISICYIWLFLY